MQCPKCPGKLREYEHQGVKIDYCRNCGGSLFDEGEVSQYFLLDKDFSDKSVLISPYDENGPRCPKDQIIMQEYLYIKGHDLKLDFCPGCYSVWFDKGEIRKLEQLAHLLGLNIKKIFEVFDFDS